MSLYAEVVLEIIEAGEPDNITPPQVTKEMELVDLGIDSLDLISLLIVLESQYEVTVPNSNISSLITVDDLVTQVRELLHENKAI